MNEIKGIYRWKPSWWHTTLRTAIVLVALALLVSYLAGRQFATAGSVELTANLGAFSSTFVKVNTAVTASLTAGTPYNYNPPVPPADEAALVPSYTWSIGPVQVASASGGPYRIAVLGTDYKIAPLPPTANTVSILTFTPIVTGYWKVSASCSVVVTDTKTGFSWNGGPVATGPKTFISYILHIDYGGAPVDGLTENVCVGEQIPLTVDVEPSDLGFQWNIMGTTVSKYAPDDSASNLTPVTAADLKASPLTFYWVLPPQSNDDDVMLQINGGPSVFSTFDVYQPNQKMTATYVGGTYVNGLYDPPGIWLYFGTAQGGDGVFFGTPVTAYPQQFGGKVDFVQTIAADAVTVSEGQYYDGIFMGDQTYQSAMPPGSPPVLDTDFTYTKTGPFSKDGVLWTDDGPGSPCSVSPVGDGGSPYYESFLIIPTMYLIYKPALANAIWVPLDSYRWGWFGAAQEGLLGGWSVQNGENNPNPPVEVTPTGEPTWNTNITAYNKVWVLQ